MLPYEKISLPHCPRPCYPRPDFRREQWMNLNGTWEFEEDYDRTGESRELYRADALKDHITVPFCRESKLSGIGHTDFCDEVWYRRRVTIPAEWRENGGRIILHIGGCDYRTRLWVNGRYVGVHIGGMNAFSFDITDVLEQGEQQTIVINAIDLLRTGTQTCGKQSDRETSYGCFYTRTTGIWQTVWLECVPAAYIRSARYFPSICDQKLTIEARVVGGHGHRLSAKAYYDGHIVGTAAATVVGQHVQMEMKLSELHLWESGNGRLYDLELELEGEHSDRVDSYFGMREIAWENGTLYLNGKAIFQRLILDQGFYPDGIWTAPTDDDLRADIDRSMAMGFNGARLHQKVFEPRFLYECDKAGYLVWGEHGNWGMDHTAPTVYQAMLPDWTEIIERDFNHPAIIGWCPLNETNPDQIPDFVRYLNKLTRALDPTRPVIDASGWYHLDADEGLCDFMDMHWYEQDVEKFTAYFEPLKQGKPIQIYFHGIPDGKQFFACPVFISEYGGIRWCPDEAGWGYGDAPKTEEEFIARFRGLTEALLHHPRITGFCYTQLTDVEQEVNGLYTYDRRAKFDPAVLRAIVAQKATIEE